MNQTTIELIERIIFGVTAFYVPREGVVLKNQDDEGLGRILVSIPSLGWDTEDKATWCFPKQVNSISTPGIDDWVIVEFVNGDRDRPVYSGYSAYIKDQLPTGYDGKKDTHILFEDPEGRIIAKYDGDQFIIGNGGEKPAARVDDPTLSDSATDATFWTMISQIVAGVNAIAPGSVTTVATSQTGKISGGSDQVQIGGK